MRLYIEIVIPVFCVQQQLRLGGWYRGYQAFYPFARHIERTASVVDDERGCVSF